MTAETRPERSKRLASEANRARRNLQLRADTIDGPRATPMPTDPASVAARRAALRGRRAA